MIVLRLGSCIDIMKSMEANSIDAIVCDPPYGLEFMGKTWDRLDIPNRAWEVQSGFSKPGIGDRNTGWPSFSTTGNANPTCSICGGRLRGAKKCSCPMPHEHWKPIGKKRKETIEEDRLEGYVADTGFKGFNLPRQRKRNILCPDCGKYIYDYPGRACTCGGVRRLQVVTMQLWHEEWLEEAYRVLKPGNKIKAFGGTRTFHRLAIAMEKVGFESIGLEAFVYGSGFPKSLNIGKAIDKQAGAERVVVGVDLGRASCLVHQREGYKGDGVWKTGPRCIETTAPATEAAKTWEGWGTALKPAWEPILVGVKK